MDALHAVALVLVLASVVALWVGALVSIVRHATSSARVAVWAVLVVLFPLVGSIAWFLSGRGAERRRTGVPWGMDSRGHEPLRK